MHDEIQSIIDNKTWTLMDLPHGRKCIGSKWVYKLKKDASGNHLKYKAHIVAKGYSQIAGLDYEETFAPVVRIEFVRLLLAIAALMNLYILHADAITAFLNGNSDVEIYMHQPEGFINQQYPHKVLKLNKSLNGLKQASRIWYLLLCSILESFGFTPYPSDNSIYTRGNIILAVYVDDILIFGPDKPSCIQVYDSLSQHFKINNLGPVKSFLGINVIRNNGTISINQSGYIDRMLKRFNLTNATPTRTPLNPSLPLQASKPNERRADPTKYQEITGSFTHLSVYSRPDIAYATSIVCQFNSDPSVTHLKA
jgi:hypothetical protein